MKGDSMINFIYDYAKGDKVKMMRTMSTVEGTLYEGTIVRVTQVGFPDKDLEVKDPVGKLWYVDFGDVEKLK
jgi:hypothetical protein|tara:strand:- start:177 stop:392 length:216 start_codon:yes stop_codon:yes gene_type:complete